MNSNIWMIVECSIILHVYILRMNMSLMGRSISSIAMACSRRYRASQYCGAVEIVGIRSFFGVALFLFIFKWAFWSTQIRRTLHGVAKGRCWGSCGPCATWLFVCGDPSPHPWVSIHSLSQSEIDTQIKLWMLMWMWMWMWISIWLGSGMEM